MVASGAIPNAAASIVAVLTCCTVTGPSAYGTPFGLAWCATSRAATIDALDGNAGTVNDANVLYWRLALVSPIARFTPPSPSTRPSPRIVTDSPPSLARLTDISFLVAKWDVIGEASATPDASVAVAAMPAVYSSAGTTDGSRPSPVASESGVFGVT